MRTRTFWAIALVVLSAACAKKRFKMPDSSSMWPNIEGGESITADTADKTPTRGSLYAFNLPEHPEQSFVKRIVGLPGDRVETKGHTLSINGKPVPSCVVGTVSLTSEGSSHKGELVLEGEGGGYFAFHEDVGHGLDGTWTVAAGQYWAMGDNRANSHDSRMWYGGVGGGVPQALIIGKVEPKKLTLPAEASSLEPAFQNCKTQLGL